jgi:replicative DNA helicase
VFANTAGSSPRLVMVDYLQFVHSRKRFERRHEAVGHVCRELKRCAKDTGLPFIVAAQLSRMVEQRGKDARPQMSDLSESSDIEKNADQIVFLHREDDGRAFVKVAKNRHGATWTSEVRYNGPVCRWEDSGWQ